MINEDKKGWISSRKLGLLASIGVFSLVFLWLIGDAETPEALMPESAPRPSVTVIETIASPQSIVVQANGTTMARWPTVVTATVSGRVTVLSENASPGRMVEAGSVLARLQNTRYRAEVEGARARIAAARQNNLSRSWQDVRHTSRRREHCRR